MSSRASSELGSPENANAVAVNRNLSSGAAVWADENVGRDAQLLAQPDDHGDGQGPVAVEHFGDARSASDDVDKTLTSRQAGKISISEMARSGDRWG